MSRRPVQEVLEENLRYYAKRRKLALSVLAERAGVSQRQMFGVLSGERAPTIVWLEKVALELDIDVHKLLVDRNAGR